MPIEKIFRLSVLDLRIWVHLGCGDQEKFNPQLVSFNIELNFQIPPVGVINDSLEDTVCYSRLVQNIKNFCRDKKFNLVEHLTAEVYKMVNESLQQNLSLVTSINVTAHKVSPPVPDIHGGVTFTYCAAPFKKE